MYSITTSRGVLAFSLCEVKNANKSMMRAAPCLCGQRGCDGLQGHVSLGWLSDLHMYGFVYEPLRCEFGNS